MDNIDPPCRLEEVISFNFQFKNLQRYLDFLNNADSMMNTQIKDLRMKLDEIEMLKAKMDDFEFTLNSNVKKFAEMENTISSHAAKFHDIDSKMWVISSKNEENSFRIESISEKTQSLEENTNNLNRITEENIKNVQKISENLDRLKMQHEITSEKTENCIRSISKVTEDLSETDWQVQNLKTNYEATVEKTEKKFEDNKIYLEDNLEKLNRKYTDTNDTLIKIIDSVTELSTGVTKNPRRGSSNILSNLMSAQNDAINNNLSVEVGKIWKEIEEFKNSNKLFDDNITNLMKKNEEYETEIKELHNKISHNIHDFSIDKEERLNTDFFDNTLNQFNPEGGNANPKAPHGKDQQIHSILPGANTEAINDNIQKLNDNIKILSSNLGHKVNRDDMEKLNKHMKAELEKHSENFNDKLKLIEFKMKTSAMASNIGVNLQSHGGESNQQDLSNIGMKITEIVERLSKEVIEQQILIINLEENKQFKDILGRVDGYKQEIDKLYESLIEVRSSMTENNKLVAIEEELRKSMKKIQDVENNFKKYKNQVEEISKNLEGEALGEEAGNRPSDMKHSFENHSGLSIRDQVKQLSTTAKINSDKIEKISSKVEGMNTEILNKLRKDLQHESQNILENFKLDLKSSINKIEEQLREKVDRFNLDEFGRRIDSKLHNEINKKLDRNDLKRNNHLINRKIDTLENKISKTLVDTLIDLQMEEAPLIVKKSMAGEKCASCNQFLAGPHNHHDSGSNNHHDNKPHHFKAGSKYSTVYRATESKYHTNPINETLEENWKKNQLPEINTNKSNDLSSTHYKKKMSNSNTTGLKFHPSQSAHLKYDDPYDRSATMMINEELEKKYVNANEIMKSVNKAYEISDKKAQLLSGSK
jgi:DNA repair exonuclease SbcCD ATPase subunit